MKPFERIIAHLVIISGAVNIVRTIMSEEESVIDEKINEIEEDLKLFISEYPLKIKIKNKYIERVNSKYKDWVVTLKERDVRVNKIEILTMGCVAFDSLLSEIPESSYTYRKLNPIYKRLAEISYIYDDLENHEFYERATELVEEFLSKINGR